MAEPVYDEVEIEDMDYDEESETYYYPCPCGDRFFITKDDLMDGEDIATCPSCSLRLRVIYDEDEFDDSDDDENAAGVTIAAVSTTAADVVVAATPVTSATTTVVGKDTVDKAESKNSDGEGEGEGDSAEVQDASADTAEVVGTELAEELAKKASVTPSGPSNEEGTVDVSHQ